MRLQFQTDFAQASLKGLTLVNGGAVVALFTFIGNTAAKFDASRLWWAFGLFIAGLTLTLLATMCGFLAQAFYMQVSFAEAYNFQDTMHGRARSHDPSRETHLGNTFEGAAVVAAFASLISFAVGSGFALAGVLSR